MNQQTLAIHAGYEKDAQSTMAVPIYQSTAYEFRDTEHAANLFALKELGNIYTRLMNPTTDVFEKRFAALEGGVAAIGTASGMAAIFYAIANVAEAGDNIIVAKQVYGGTTTLSGHTIKRFGIETRYFDVRNPGEFETLIDEKTKSAVKELSLYDPPLRPFLVIDGKLCTVRGYYACPLYFPANPQGVGFYPHPFCRGLAQPLTAPLGGAYLLPLLDEQHLEAGPGSLPRGHASAWTSAHHDDIPLLDLGHG